MNYLAIENEFIDKMWKLAKNLIPIIYMLVTFVLLYKFSPSKSSENMVTFRGVLPGAIFSTFGVIIASLVFWILCSKLWQILHNLWFSWRNYSFSNLDLFTFNNYFNWGRNKRNSLLHEIF